MISPRSEVVVRWVQFSDGSTIGDSGYARELLASREVVLKNLRLLKEAYVNGGAEKFDERLKERIEPPVADAYIDHIRVVAQMHGTENAVETLEMHLDIGEQRSRLFTGSQ